jgi:hypothetical protein
MAAGTIDAAGKAHLNSDYVVLGFAVGGAYGGTIGAHGGTLTGTQSWQWPNGSPGSRTCVAAFVPAPRHNGRRRRSIEALDSRGDA